MDPQKDGSEDLSSDELSLLEDAQEGAHNGDDSNMDGEASPPAATVDAPAQESPSASDLAEEEGIIRSRAYQIEMFEESLKRNVIVTMDTGSGKTQVAVLRIQAELEKSSDKIVWFLATTVMLCEQQFRVLQSQIPAAQVKKLTGADGIDTWSDPRTWDDYLRNVHIVVSTHQVLLDAISHGFVPLSRLSLLVFDEAHNCVGNHPGASIMGRYRMSQRDGLPCPAILGLTASPMMKSNPNNIYKLEQTLDAVCRAPTIHKAELLSTVNRPTVSSIVIPDLDAYPSSTKSMSSLADALRSLRMNITSDPWILHLRAEGTPRSHDRLREALMSRKTDSIRQMETLHHRCIEARRQLGPWAADYYIYTSVTRFLQSLDRELSLSEMLKYKEKEYLANALRTVYVKPPCPFDDVGDSDLSDKFRALVSVLQSVPDDARCIVFAREIVIVDVLHHMLSAVPSLKTRFRVGAVIGTSNYSGRKDGLGDLKQHKHSAHLDGFRSGAINLLIATSVAEEGIDVPACNCVICFDTPANVKSFIQRRGRARAEKSSLVLLAEASSNKLREWQSMEEEMRKRYEDETRCAPEQADDEDTNPIAREYLYAASTQARLEFAQAKSHLEHFCRKITNEKNADVSPYYVSRRIANPSGGADMFTATVYLPSSVAPAPRQIKGLGEWCSEANAFKDAAFQAFKTIYEHGLVNDNFLPLIDDILADVETRSAITLVDSAWKPWPDMARLWRESSTLVQRDILLRDGPRVMAKFHASLPRDFPVIPPFHIYWDAESTWTVEIGEECRTIAAGTLGADQSAALLDLAYGHRWEVEDSAHVLHLRSSEELPFKTHTGRKAAKEDAVGSDFLIRGPQGSIYSFLKWLPCKPPAESVKRFSRLVEGEPDDGPWLAVKKLPRPRCFFSPNSLIAPVSDGRYPTALPALQCTVDTVDRAKVYFGTVLPSIIHMFEVYYTAEELCRTILRDVNFTNISLVVTAISSRAAGLPTDYERLEFFGDSILKLAATVSVMVQYPHLPEGYLTAMKNRIVSNSRLCRAAIEAGLDKFILNERYNAKKWRPYYIKNYTADEKDATPSKREMSTKTLADVVEALIGAAYQEGGMSKALVCLRTLIPDVEWHDFHEAQAILFARKQEHVITELAPYYGTLETLIGYEFRNKALLIEALTHSSWQLSRSSESSMEVLELLGDAVLDSVITFAMWEQDVKPEMANYEMASLRMATVNADLLGFFVMGWHTMQESTAISPERGHATITFEKPVAFWQFMRKGSKQISILQDAAKRRYDREKEDILHAMAHGDATPWAKLAHLSLPKFFCDMFEALLGAVFVDSGSMDACAGVVERIGILPYLRRLIADNVVSVHPKNILGELAADRKLRYESGFVLLKNEDGTPATTLEGNPAVEYVCTVFIDEQHIVRVTGGVSHEEIRTKAADEACRILLQRKKNNKKKKHQLFKRKHTEDNDDDIDVAMTG